MTRFSAEWLDSREPLDAASRAGSLGTTLAKALRADASRNLPIRVIDLGAGTGANLRYLAPLLGGRQDWLLVDQDPELLGKATGRMRSWASSHGAIVVESEGDSERTICATNFECRVRSLSINLATELAQLALPGGALVTASALLDLVSADWLSALAQSCVTAVAPVWFALTCDGRLRCDPAEPEDEEVCELFHTHQRSDKGFGPALGPLAAEHAARIFGGVGYRTDCKPSDWLVRPEERLLQQTLLEDWFAAACEIAPARTAELREWRNRRRSHIDHGRSEFMVGHIDMIGVPQRD